MLSVGLQYCQVPVHLGLIFVSGVWTGGLVQLWKTEIPFCPVECSPLVSCPQTSGESSYSSSPSGWTLFLKYNETTRDFLLPLRNFSISPNFHATQNSAKALGLGGFTHAGLSPACANLSHTVFSLLQQNSSARSGRANVQNGQLPSGEKKWPVNVNSTNIPLSILIHLDLHFHTFILFTLHAFSYIF